MNVRKSEFFIVLVVVLALLSTTLGGCGRVEAPKPTPEAQPVSLDRIVNSAGVELPPDAAPLEEQVLRIAGAEGSWLSWDASAYDTTDGFSYGIQEVCLRTDKDYNPIPAGCDRYEVSEDGLTWTFHLGKDRIWSDGHPIGADDYVFTLQRYARLDYDFEWFYSMAGIKNWSKVVNGELPAQELGVKVVDDLTFTVTTDSPTPFLPKIFTLLYIAPEHIVKDRLADGSWAINDATRVSAAPYILESWTKGKEMVWVINKNYKGPFQPKMEKIVLIFMDSAERFNAYKNGELDVIGYSYEGDLSPAAMAQIMADPKLKDQWISWPNFNTYYLFFDTWSAPFDNLKVRQAISHAIDRDSIINGPLKYQGQAAYTMNPPGFPGEDVDGLKPVQQYDPELAAKLLAEAGYAGGKGFPKLKFYLRDASPTVVNTGEAIAAMLKQNLGIEVEIQNLDYDMFTEKMWGQKGDTSGDFKLALVPYEFDFVDGSNMLSVWGGCETAGTPMAEMPGRHTWYNQQFNSLLCEAQSLMGDEARRNDMYKQAERILVEDVALVPVFHGIYNVLVSPKLKGPGLSQNQDGVTIFRRFDEVLIYKTK